MTAANATHNTCLILLHERIAYPDQNLHWVQLPSLDSAEICVRAATEVCTIITKFLEQRPASYALAPQLGLTAFVSARTLLSKSLLSFTPTEGQLTTDSTMAPSSYAAFASILAIIRELGYDGRSMGSA
jgi:hypothetical protein